MITTMGKVKNITGKKLRLIYDDKKAIAVIEGTEKTITSTIHKSKEFESEKEIAAFIEKEKLIPLPEKQELSDRGYRYNKENT